MAENSDTIPTPESKNTQPLQPVVPTESMSITELLELLPSGTIPISSFSRGQQLQMAAAFVNLAKYLKDNLLPQYYQEPIHGSDINMDALKQNIRNLEPINAVRASKRAIIMDISKIWATATSPGRNVLLERELTVKKLLISIYNNIT
jgi:hypothetical protein